MSDPKVLLSSSEFAKKAGVSSATVSKWLRGGKIKGNKQGGKWMISKDQLPDATMSKTEVKQTKPVGNSTDKKPGAAPAGKSNTQSYTIEVFSAMSYLTPFGVERYLKEGRLSGLKNQSGQWQVDGSNLEREEIQGLLRK